LIAPLAGGITPANILDQRLLLVMRGEAVFTLDGFENADGGDVAARFGDRAAGAEIVGVGYSVVESGSGNKSCRISLISISCAVIIARFCCLTNSIGSCFSSGVSF